MDPRVIGNRIRALRRLAKLSQEALSERAGIDRTTLAKIETGSRLPDLSTTVSLADALGVSTSAIVDHMEAGRAEVKGLIERFRASPWAQTLIPPATEGELREIEAMGDILWTRLPPTEQAIQLLVLALRAEKQTG